MGVLRAIAIFLVGAGIMLGAHMTGLIDRASYFFAHRDNSFAVATPISLDRHARGRVDLRRVADSGPDFAQMVVAPHAEEAPFAVRIAVEDGSSGEDGCAPVYDFSNHTHLPIIFAPTPDQGRTVKVPPGQTLRSNDDDVDDDGPGYACGAVIRVVLEQ